MNLPEIARDSLLAHKDVNLIVHVGVGLGSEKKPSNIGKKDTDFDWMSVAYQGAYALATATMFATLADSQQLDISAQLVQQLGSQQQTFKVNLGSLGGKKEMTISQLVADEASAAKQGGQNGSNEASVYQSAIGQAQAEMSQNVQIGQEFSSQETNQATSVDPQGTNQAESQMSSLNTALGQWVQIVGPISG